MPVMRTAIEGEIAVKIYKQHAHEVRAAAPIFYKNTHCTVSQTMSDPCELHDLILVLCFILGLQIHVTSLLVGSVVDASVETLLMGPLIAFATLVLLETLHLFVLVRSAQTTYKDATPIAVS